MLWLICRMVGECGSEGACLLRGEEGGKGQRGGWVVGGVAEYQLLRRVGGSELSKSSTIAAQ